MSSKAGKLNDPWILQVLMMDVLGSEGEDSNSNDALLREELSEVAWKTNIALREGTRSMSC